MYSLFGSEDVARAMCAVVRVAGGERHLLLKLTAGLGERRVWVKVGPEAGETSLLNEYCSAYG